MRARLKRAATAFLTRLMPLLGPETAPPAPARAGILAALGLGSDPDYARRRAQQRDETIQRLSGCSPANSSPEALAGYVGRPRRGSFGRWGGSGRASRQRAGPRP